MTLQHDRLNTLYAAALDAQNNNPGEQLVAYLGWAMYQAVQYQQNTNTPIEFSGVKVYGLIGADADYIHIVRADA